MKTFIFIKSMNTGVFVKRNNTDSVTAEKSVDF